MNRLEAMLLHLYKSGDFIELDHRLARLNGEKRINYSDAFSLLSKGYIARQSTEDHDYYISMAGRAWLRELGYTVTEAANA